MKILHFNMAKVSNLKPYLAISLSNSRSSGYVKVGITDGQTTFYHEYNVSRSGDTKLNIRNNFYFYKSHYGGIEGIPYKSLDNSHTFLFEIEKGRKIIFNDFLNFEKLCDYHTQNKKRRVAELLEFKKKEALEREKAEREKAEAIEKKILKKENIIKVKDLVDYASIKDGVKKWFSSLTKEEKELLKTFQFGEEVPKDLVESELLSDYINCYSSYNLSMMLFSDYGDGYETHYTYLGEEDMDIDVQQYVPAGLNNEDEEDILYYKEEVTPFLENSIELSILKDLLV